MHAIQYLLIYALAANLVGFAMMGIDKLKAKRRKWRIPEASLFLVAILGGSIGSIAGMYTFRHKTQKKLFKIGMPVILALQVIGVIALIFSPLDFVFM